MNVPADSAEDPLTTSRTRIPLLMPKDFDWDVSRYDTPMAGRTTCPSRINVDTSYLSVSTGMANPIPADAPDKE